MEKTLLFWRALFDGGVFTNPVLSPAVPPDSTLIRTSYMAIHTDEECDRILEIAGQGGEEARDSVADGRAERRAGRPSRRSPAAAAGGPSCAPLPRGRRRGSGTSGASATSSDSTLRRESTVERGQDVRLQRRRGALRVLVRPTAGSDTILSTTRKRSRSCGVSFSRAAASRAFAGVPQQISTRSPRA